VEDQCTCWICFEIFESPITLHCTHTFCKECLAKVYKKDKQCPFCRRPFSLPLPEVNKTIEKLVNDFLERKKQVEEGGGGNVVMALGVEQESILLQLPEEIIIGILFQLSPKDVSRSARSCHWLHSVANDNYVWREFAHQLSPFCNPEKYNRNWKLCYIGMKKRQRGWDEGRAGDFEVTTMRGHEDFISCFSFYKSKIFSGSADRTVRIWNSQKKTSIATLAGHNGPISCLQAGDVMVASGASDGVAKLWDIGTGINMFNLNHGPNVASLIFDENQLVTGGFGEAKVWDLRTQTLTHTLGQHTQTITSVKKNDQGQIATLSQDCLKVWDLRAPVEDNRIILGPAPPPANRWVLNVAGGSCFQIAKNNVVVGRQDGNVHVYDSSGPAQPPPRILQGRGVVNSLQCDGSKVVAGSSDNNLRVWDMNTQALRYTLADHTGPVHSVQFDSQKIVSCSADNTVKVWNMATGQRMYSLLGGSLQQRGNNKPNPTKPGCSDIQYNEYCIAASINSLVRIYNFEPGLQQ